MEIEFENFYKYCDFEEIEVGECFANGNGDAFMKIVKTKDDCNAVMLKNGTVWEFTPHLEVLPLDSHITLRIKNKW